MSFCRQFSVGEGLLVAAVVYLKVLAPSTETEENHGRLNKDSRLTCLRFKPGNSQKISYN
jgi:hypothetical protein